jgi:hypothetical protein
MQQHIRRTRLFSRTLLSAALLAAAFPAPGFADGPAAKPDREEFQLKVIDFESTVDLDSKTTATKMRILGDFSSGLENMPIRSVYVEPTSVMSGEKNILTKTHLPTEDEVEKMTMAASQWGGTWKPRAEGVLKFSIADRLPMTLGPITLKALILKPEKLETTTIDPLAVGDPIHLVKGLDGQILAVEQQGTPQVHVKYLLHVAVPPEWNEMPAWPSQLCSVSADGHDGQKVSVTYAMDGIKRKKTPDGWDFLGLLVINAYKEPPAPGTLRAEVKVDPDATQPAVPPGPSVQVDRLRLEVGTGIKPKNLVLSLEKADLSAVPFLFPPPGPGVGDANAVITAKNEKGWRVELTKMVFRTISGLPSITPYRFGAEFRLYPPEAVPHFKLAWADVGSVVAATVMHEARLAPPKDFPPHTASEYWALGNSSWGTGARLVANFQTYPGEPAVVEQIVAHAVVVTPVEPSTRTIDYVPGKIPLDMNNGVTMTIDEPAMDERQQCVRVRLRSFLSTEDVKGKPKPSWVGKQITSVVPLDEAGRDMPFTLTPSEHGSIDDTEATESDRYQITLSMQVAAVDGKLVKPTKLRVETASSVAWEDVTVVLPNVDLASVPGLLPTR